MRRLMMPLLALIVAAPAWAVAAPQGPVFGGTDLATLLPNRLRLRAVGAWEDEGFGVGPAAGEVFLMTLLIRRSRTVVRGASWPAIAESSRRDHASEHRARRSIGESSAVT